MGRIISLTLGEAELFWLLILFENRFIIDHFLRSRLGFSLLNNYDVGIYLVQYSWFYKLIHTHNHSK